MNILLADDRPRVRNALCILLEQQPQWVVVGEAADACELLDQTKSSQPDLVLLDGKLPGMREDGYLQSIREICPQVCIVALVDPQPVQRSAWPEDVDGFATKVNSPEYLLSVIRSCLERRAC